MPEINTTSSATHSPKNKDSSPSPLNMDNYEFTVLEFNERQAGVSLIFDPIKDEYLYHAYVTDTKTYKDIFSVECQFPDDAIAIINQEFGQWEKRDFSQKQGCQTCVKG